MRPVQWPSRLLLLLLLAVLTSESAGQRRRQPSSDASLSIGWSRSAAAGSGRSIRDSLQEVRQQLREPHITRAQRRQLKSRKRRLREELRLQRARRRRERRERRRQQARARQTVTAPELAVERSATGPSEPGSGLHQPPETVTETDSLTGATELLAAPSGEGLPADGEDQLLSADERQLAVDGTAPGGDGDSDGAESPTALEASDEEEAAAGGGGFLSSLWDWVAPAEETEPESEPEPEPESEQDAGWTVPPLQDGRKPNIVLIMADDLDVELGECSDSGAGVT